jgi:hypothetical protein
MGMTYDGTNSQIVLFGGCCDPSGNYWNDTWTWDGSTWHNVTPGGTNPCPRVSTRMIWDGHQVMLFGGRGKTSGCTGLLDDTWTWNGSAWTPCVAPTGCLTGQPTQARESEGMAYDQSNPPDATAGDVIMFGGNETLPSGSATTPDELIAASGPGNDTWQWDGAGLSWTQLSPTGTLPCTRNSAGMAFDFATTTNRILMFGGQGGTDCNGGLGGPLNDTWTWSGTKWVLCSTSCTGAPSPRTGHRVAWDNDTAIQRVVLFGGSSSISTSNCSGSNLLCNDTWYIDGGPWSQQTPMHSPTKRCCVGLAYDALHNRLVLFGGGVSKTSNKDDTWLWNGTDWCQAGVSC